MSSPVAIFCAGILTVPISSAPKMSSSLTSNSKYVTWVCQWNIELLVPLRVPRVIDHTCARHRGLGHQNFDVRIAGDDFAVVVDLAIVFATTTVRLFFGVWDFDSATGGEAVAEVLCHDVHVGQVLGPDDLQVQVTVEERDLRVCTGLGHFRS
jgi:hypothetical protein